MNSHSEQMIDRINLDKEIEMAAKIYSKDELEKTSFRDFAYNTERFELKFNSFISGTNYLLNNCKLYTEEEVLLYCEKAFNRIISLPNDTVIFKMWVKDFFEQNKKK